MQYQFHCFRAFLSISILVLLSACASNHTFTKTSFKTEQALAPMSKVLLIAIGKHKDNTVNFETMMAKQLETQGVTAISAHSKLSEDTKITRELAAQLSKEYATDSVIVTRLVNAKLNRKKVENRTELVVDRPPINIFTDIFSLDISEEEALLQKDIATTVIVSTEVFSTLDGTKIAAFETEVVGVQDPYTKMTSSISHVIEKLKSERLIK